MRFSKNNKQMRSREDSDRLQHFGIRKLSVGVASVILSTTMYLGAGQIHAVKADTSSSDDNSSVSTDTDNGIHDDTYQLGQKNTDDKQTSDNSTDTTSDNNTDKTTDTSVDTKTTTKAKTTSANLKKTTVLATSENPANIADWNYTISGNTATLNSYKNTSNQAIVLPVAKDFVNAGNSDVTTVNISASVMKGIVSGGATSISISDTDPSQKVTASDSDWTNAFNNVTKYAFNSNKTLVSVDLDRLDIKNITNLRSAFAYDEVLMDVNINGWDTSNVTNMSQLFYTNKSLKKIDLSKWNTSNVTDLSEMFMYDVSLEEVDAADWDTSKVTSMSQMFNRDDNFSTIDVSKWDTSNVTLMNSMFSYTNLEKIDVSNWNTSKVKDMSYMFIGLTKIKEIDVSKWDTSSAVKIPYVFYGTDSLTHVDLSNWDTRNVTDMSYMFYSSGVKTVNFSGDNNYITGYTAGLFGDTKNLTVVINDQAHNKNNVTLIRSLAMVNTLPIRSLSLLTKDEYTQQVNADLEVVNDALDSNDENSKKFIALYNQDNQLTDVPTDPDNYNFGPASRALHVIAQVLQYNDVDDGETLSNVIIPGGDYQTLADVAKGTYYVPATVDQSYGLNDESEVDSSLVDSDTIPGNYKVVGWKTAPDTSTYTYDDLRTALLTISDGENSYDIPVTYAVTSSKEENSVSENDYHIYLVGETPAVGDFLTDVPDDASTTDDFKQTTAVGTGEGSIEVEFGDESTSIYDVYYLVVKAKDNVDLVRPGTTINAKDYVEVPTGENVEISWEKAPDNTVSSTTPQDATALVTWKDEDGNVLATREVPVKVTVLSMADQYAADFSASDQAYAYKEADPKISTDALNFSANKDAILADISSVTWAHETPDTSVAGKTGTAKALITFTDGSSTQKDVKYTVANSTSSDIDKYDLSAKSVTYSYKENVTDDQAKLHVVNLPVDASVVWDQKPDTSKLGEGSATVKITFGDGTSTTLAVPYTVDEKTTDAYKSAVSAKDNVVYSQGDDPKAEDALVDLPEDATATWTKAPDTSKLGEGNAEVKVTFADGSEKLVEVPYTVNKKETDADKSTVAPKDNVTFNQGDDPKPEDVVTNVPEGSKVDWKDDTKPDTSKTGDGKAAVVVTYPDGSTKEFEVPYTVNKKETDADKYNPEVQKVTITEGDAFDPASAIANKNDLPAGTSYSVVGTIDTGKVGDQTIKVKVSYPDGSSDEVEVVVSVAAKSESKTDQTSKDDQSTSKEDQTEDDKTSSKDTKSTSKSSAHNQKKTVSHRVKKSSAKTLPQTGEASISALGLIALILAGSMGFKKKDE